MPVGRSIKNRRAISLHNQSLFVRCSSCSVSRRSWRVITRQLDVHCPLGITRPFYEALLLLPARARP